MAILVVQSTEGPVKVSTRWVGNNLAVHSSLIKREDIEDNIGQATKNKEEIWHYTITHKATGMSGAKFRMKDLNVALRIAKQFDDLFHYKNMEEIEADDKLVKEWKDEVAKYKGRA